jgi:phospholipase/lecithinase/hemolysin
MNMLITLFFLLFSGLISANSLNKIVVFGDSLSDNGNFYEFMKHRLPQSPPYYKGHFTNGPVWIERLAFVYFPSTSAEHLLDYAFGGAGVSGNNNEDILFTLEHELDTYFLTHENKADAQSLFIIWIGANNYLYLPSDEDVAVMTVIHGIKQSIEQLVAKGAQHIMVLNLPDLGRAPVARAVHEETKISSLVNRHNEQLAQMLQSLKDTYPAVQWIYFDVNQSINKLLDSPKQYGFDNIKESCLDTVLTNSTEAGLSLPYALLNVTGNKSTIIDACQGYLFFDAVHPTKLAHQIIADQAQAVLNAANIKFNH